MTWACSSPWVTNTAACCGLKAMLAPVATVSTSTSPWVRTGRNKRPAPALPASPWCWEKVCRSGARNTSTRPSTRGVAPPFPCTIRIQRSIFGIVDITGVPEAVGANILSLVPESRPYRLPHALVVDAELLRNYLDRGAQPCVSCRRAHPGDRRSWRIWWRWKVRTAPGSCPPSCRLLVRPCLFRWSARQQPPRADRPGPAP